MCLKGGVPCLYLSDLLFDVFAPVFDTNFHKTVIKAYKFLKATFTKPT